MFNFVLFVVHVVGLARLARLSRADAVLGGLVGEVAKSFPNENPLIVENAVAKAVQEAAGSEDVPLSELECIRDYGRACPEGWFPHSGSHCKAPLSYTGQCQSLVDFGNMTPAQKSAQATLCGAQFPCVDACAEDFGQTCPQGWRLQHDNCVAPASYPGPCVGHKHMDHYNAEDKKYWAHVCHVHWPCLSPSNRVLGSHRIRGEAKKHCSWDDAALCPSEWQLTAKWCIAPHGYKGACALFMRQGPYSRDQMQALSVSCALSWPCQRTQL